ncbi:MAG: acyl carrier protein [Bacteroidetes bacterium]|nr:acyl carrier protein [Bacteroidota bacterium]
MKREVIVETTTDFIRKNFLFDDKVNLGECDSLLGAGILDSTGVLELIAFLELTYGVSFKDEELVAENFDSIAKIAGFVSGKIGNPVG